MKNSICSLRARKKMPFEASPSERPAGEAAQANETKAWLKPRCGNMSAENEVCGSRSRAQPNGIFLRALMALFLTALPGWSSTKYTDAYMQPIYLFHPGVPDGF